MGFSHFFVDRPIFAGVLSIVILLIGGLAWATLPVAQYPEVAPPTIQVTASYPGASAEVVANTVATPIEQEVNGVEGMLYMTSQSTNDGTMTLTIPFEVGTDLDDAQILVQNRVSIAEPRLPEPVRRLGVTTIKNSPDLMMVIHLNSPDGTYDQLYISNYALLQIRDVLARIPGVGQVRIFGAREYSMRVWLDPDRVASYGLTAGDVVAALRAQNLQVASGVLNQQPMPDQGAVQLNVQTQGRLVEPDEFGDIVVKSGAGGRLVRVRDVGRVELGARDYITNSYLNDKPAVAVVVFQRPGSNALDTADAVKGELQRLGRSFPEGLAYDIVYNPIAFIAESVNEVYKTIFEATLLVVLVVFVFLQSVRGAIIPVIAIPISLIGTFAVMQLLGFSLNSLSLFGLVLAIGIVVDDAIVVVENVERNLRGGMTPREAAHKTMNEVGSALVSIALVLSAVFVPTAFLSGIAGEFYRQFGVTIAVATIISAFVSLTLSPALAAMLLKENAEADEPKPWERPLRSFFAAFNAGFERLSAAYSGLVRKLVRVGATVFLVYAGLIVVTGLSFSRTPTGFIPSQDQGFFIIAFQLPPGASLNRADEVIRRAIGIARDVPGIKHAVGFAGFNGATFTNAANAGLMFTPLEDFSDRRAQGLTFAGIRSELQQKLNAIDEAFVVVVVPPPVRGIGRSGGFKMMVQDRAGRGLEALHAATFSLMIAANQDPMLQGVFTFFEVSTPQLFADIDRVKAEMLGVPVDNVFEALEIYLGSAFVNDFNLLGRTYRVTAQADSDYRQTPEDVARLRTRNAHGDMVPIGSVATFREIAGPSRVPHHNIYPAAGLQGAAAPGFSSGQALERMEKLAEEVLPPGIEFEWTELAYQQTKPGTPALAIFALAVVFVFLVLAAQYESWTLPLAVILIVPMCLLFAVTGVNLRGMDNNILTQIGLIVLVGLAAKNAILIVEFARQKEREGLDRFAAAVEAAGLRLRPILMTSFAFILGVVPLVIASGAGSEMRQALGTAVFSGMIGVTFFGLLLTPVFYVATRSISVSHDRRAIAGRGGEGAAGPVEKPDGK